MALRSEQHSSTGQDWHLITMTMTKNGMDGQNISGSTTSGLCQGDLMRQHRLYGKSKKIHHALKDELTHRRLQLHWQHLESCQLVNATAPSRDSHDARGVSIVPATMD